MDSSKLPRRTLLRRGLLVIAGTLGLVAAERRPGGDAVAAPPLPQPGHLVAAGTLRLYARSWRPQIQPASPARTAEADHLVAYADLFDAPDGAVVGRVCTNGFCPQTPFGHAVTAAPTIEFQTLALKSGSIFGIGAAGLDAGAHESYAVVGGTGEFAGVRGMYTVRAVADSPRRGTVQFTLTLTT